MQSELQSKLRPILEEGRVYSLCGLLGAVSTVAALVTLVALDILNLTVWSGAVLVVAISGCFAFIEDLYISIKELEKMQQKPPLGLKT